LANTLRSTGVTVAEEFQLELGGAASVLLFVLVVVLLVHGGGARLPLLADVVAGAVGCDTTNGLFDCGG
jgi:hypothetical protein